MDEQRKKQLRAEVEAKLAREAAIRAKIEAKLAKELQEKEWNQLNARANEGDVNAQYELAECYFFGNNVEEDYSAAVEWYTKAASSGDLASQKRLYDCYFKGNGIARNAKEAIKWLTKAADSGDAESQLNLANRFKDGIDVKKNPTKAFHYFQLSAKQGLWRAIYNLGNWCYLLGNGVDINYEQAVFWLGKAINNCVNEVDFSGILREAKRAYGVSISNYGWQLEQESTDSATLKKVFEMYQSSADYGCVHGFARLGHCYQYGIGVNVNPKKASDYYVRAMNLGLDETTLDNWMKDFENIALKLYGGSLSDDLLSSWYSAGEDCFSISDYYKAFKWYRRAANYGHIASLEKLYDFYLNGIVVDKNVNEAIKWLTMAADAGDAESQYRLAERYANGIDVNKDFAKAFYYFALSAKQHYHLSEVELGKCYLFGFGVERNLVNAVHWLDLACAESSDESERQLLASALAYYGFELEHKEPDPGTLSIILEFYKRSATLSNKYGIAYLGHCYHYGIGVDIDLVKADELYVKAKNKGYEDSSFDTWLNELEDNINEKAESGVAFAQGLLGAWYLTGSHGEKNDEKAYYWLSEGAKLGNDIALYYLGEYFELKLYNDEVAFLLYKKSANHNVKAMVKLGNDCYGTGTVGGVQDSVMSACWLGRAYYSSNPKDETIRTKYEDAISKCISYQTDNLLDVKIYDVPKKHGSLFDDTVSIIPNWIKVKPAVQKCFHSNCHSNDVVSDNDTRYSKATIVSNDFLTEVAEYVVSTQKASTSDIQRKFEVGFYKAGIILDLLEKAGVVGPARGAIPRDVIISNKGILNKRLDTYFSHSNH